ncbi:MAG TPA: DUF4215 domain-containing protein [Polyangiaceae bacterium]|nr:DUF4215 domain-containing protein [Polyangiaceae bacterium]
MTRGTKGSIRGDSTGASSIGLAFAREKLPAFAAVVLLAAACTTVSSASSPDAGTIETNPRTASGGSAGTEPTEPTGPTADASSGADAATSTKPGVSDAAITSGGRDGGTIPVPTEDSGTPSPPASSCGDGVLQSGEQCDDGNHVEGDGCSGACTDTRACDACLQAAIADPDNGLNGPDGVLAMTPGLYPPCEGLTGYAPAGPAAGEPRIDLCRAVYDCALRTKCGQQPGSGFDPSSCYCGTTQQFDCLIAGRANGPCKDDIEAGDETSDPSTILQGFANPAFPGGLAIASLRVDSLYCPDVCFTPPVPDAGTTGAGGATGSGGTSSGGTSSNGGTSSSGGAQSAGGTTASGGSSGASGGGSGGAAGASSHAAEDLLQTNRGADCLTCAQTNCPGGPNAPDGTLGLLGFDALTGSDQQLALDMLSCVFPASGTSCAVTDISDCYCGTSGSNCLQPNAANGTCKGVIEKALGTTDPQKIGPALGDASLPGGVTTILARCLLFADDTLGDPTCSSCFQAP